MSAESHMPFRSALEFHDERERLGCANDHVDRVRFEGVTTARRLCRGCKKDFFGVSS